MGTTIRTCLADGTPIALRPITSDDEARLREGIARLSDRSRYLRFFTGARHLPDAVVKRLADADGHRHIAWGALDMSASEPKAIGAAHAMREDEGPVAEIAFAILDDYQGQGLARTLLAAIAYEAAREGVRTLRADVLSENVKAKGLMRALGARATVSDGIIATFEANVTTVIERLKRLGKRSGAAAVLDALERQDRHAA